MVFSDHALARRLEAVEATGARLCAEALARLRPDSGAAAVPFAGGTAAFCGPDSPLTQVMGAGMSGPVTPEEIDALEEFFGERGAEVRVDLCPFADDSLLTQLGERGYRPTELKNVLVRTLRPDEVFSEPPDRIAFTEVGDDNVDQYARAVARGFCEGEEPPPETVEIFRIFHVAEATCVLASVDGEVAGGGSMDIHGDVVALFGTATLPAHRGQGVHTALLHHRLRRAVAAGCDLAMISTRPGTQSQRNAEVLGFQVVHTRMTMTRHLDRHASPAP